MKAKLLSMPEDYIRLSWYDTNNSYFTAHTIIVHKDDILYLKGHTGIPVLKENARTVSNEVRLHIGNPSQQTDKV